MSSWVAKRFWTDVKVVEQENGFAVELDSRPVKTPAKAPLVVPSDEMGEAIAEEWRAVVEEIDPTVMPFTRSANAAIDKVSIQFHEVAEMLAAYGGSDLLCYRANSPEELVERQNVLWDPILRWAEEAYGGKLISNQGIMPIEQDESVLKSLAAPLFSASAFELAAFHDLIAMSGSLVLGLSVTQRRLSAAEAWNLSRLDETWQEEQWGVDEDATQVAEIKRVAFMHAARFYFMANLDSRG